MDTAGGAVRDAPAQRYPAAKAATTVTTQREFTNGRDIVCGLDSGSLQSRQLGASSNTGRSWAPSSAEEIAQADVSLASAGRRESLSKSHVDERTVRYLGHFKELPAREPRSFQTIGALWSGDDIR